LTLQQQNVSLCAARTGGRTRVERRNDPNIKAARGHGMSALPSTLNITLNHRIWRITLDGAFYGDYRTRRHATDSADAAASALRAQGRVVTIVAPPVTT
jgi:hypothetical protein